MTPETANFCATWLGQIPTTCRPHFYNLSHKHRVVFLMRTPLVRALPDREPLLPYVEACRRILLDWFLRTRDVWDEIARSLPPNIVGATLTKCEDLMQHVHFTDCIKCESTEKDIRQHRGHCASCLQSEFALLKSSKLFISVGGEAWGTARNLVGPLSPVLWQYQHLKRGLPTADSDVMEGHGVLFENPATNKFVIPVTFPGGRVNALRDSYLEYLKEGLAALDQRSSSNLNLDAEPDSTAWQDQR